jgi:exodeoxyribonuclease VII small subunit
VTQRSDSEATTDSATPMRFEEALCELESIVNELEDGRLGLSESLGRYEMGVKLLRQCHGLLEQAERKIEILSGLDPSGKPLTAPFDAESSLDPTGNEGLTRKRRRVAEKPAKAEPPQDDGGLF